MLFGGKIKVKARPGAKKASIRERAGVLVVAVTERATEGKANRAIERALAAHFNVAPSRVRIVSGHTSRDKVVVIE